MRALITLCCCLAEAGEVEAVVTLVERIPDASDPLAYYLAGALARVGATGMALDQLSAVVDRGWAEPDYLASDPDLESLRREPRFRRIQAQLAVT